MCTFFHIIDISTKLPLCSCNSYVPNHLLPYFLKISKVINLSLNYNYNIPMNRLKILTKRSSEIPINFVWVGYPIKFLGWNCFVSISCVQICNFFTSLSIYLFLSFFCSFLESETLILYFLIWLLCCLFLSGLIQQWCSLL
jgi:hypothetical protein